ncbi:MAG: hypothetical protein GXO42_00855 [bacterium]|nr:hypothetical protein [bacterium]
MSRFAGQLIQVIQAAKKLQAELEQVCRQLLLRCAYFSQLSKLPDPAAKELIELGAAVLLAGKSAKVLEAACKLYRLEPEKFFEWLAKQHGASLSPAALQLARQLEKPTADQLKKEASKLADLASLVSDLEDLKFCVERLEDNINEIAKGTVSSYTYASIKRNLARIKDICLDIKAARESLKELGELELEEQLEKLARMLNEEQVSQLMQAAERREKLLLEAEFVEKVVSAQETIITAIGILHQALVQASIFYRAASAALNKATKEQRSVLQKFEERLAEYMFENSEEVLQLHNSIRTVQQFEENLLDLAETVGVPKAYYFIYKLLTPEEKEQLVSKKKQLDSNLEILLHVCYNQVFKYSLRLLLDYLAAVKLLETEHALRFVVSRSSKKLQYKIIKKKVLKLFKKRESLLELLAVEGTNLAQQIFNEAVTLLGEKYALLNKLAPTKVRSIKEAFPLLGLALIVHVLCLHKLVTKAAQLIYTAVGEELDKQYKEVLKTIMELSPSELLGEDPAELLARKFPELAKPEILEVLGNRVLLRH